MKHTQATKGKQDEHADQNKRGLNKGSRQSQQQVHGRCVQADEG